MGECASINTADLVSGPQLFRRLWQEMGAKVDLFNCNYCQCQHRDINLAERAAGAVPENKYLTGAQGAGEPHSKPTRPPFLSRPAQRCAKQVSAILWAGAPGGQTGGQSGPNRELSVVAGPSNGALFWCTGG